MVKLNTLQHNMKLENNRPDCSYYIILHQYSLYNIYYTTDCMYINYITVQHSGDWLMVQVM